jgi:3-oxoacyl-[acyl-carrier-protein] synthase II
MAGARVAITGVGMITCLGTSVAECWPQLVEGRTGVAPIAGLEAAGCRTRFGGALPPAYDALERRELSKRLFRQTSRTTRLGLLCAREALLDSGFDLARHDPARCGVMTGSGRTGFEAEADLAQLQQGPDRYAIIQQMANALSAWISITHGFKGRSYNVATACASGAFAIAHAGEYILSGRGDAALVVGADAMLSAQTIKGFNLLSALSERNDRPESASRPFDRDRDGFVLADGGAALMLEQEASARARGARIYAWLAGASMCSEAYNIVAPRPSGGEMADAMQRALADAGVAPEAVQYVSAHGTATLQNDADETLALKLAFGPHARRLAVSSQKSMTGHSVGGAGAIECVATALSLHHGVVTPTINYTTPDPDCDLDYVPNAARELPGLRVAVSNSFAFGGHNASLVLVKAD